MTESCPTEGIAGHNRAKMRSATIMMHRRIGNLKSGSGVYLLGLCTCLDDCGYGIRIVMAPVTSFGYLPICRPDPVLAQRGIRVQWPGTIRVGGAYVSIRAAVWLRALRRCGVFLGSAVSRCFGGSRTSYPSDLGKALRPREAQEVVVAVNVLPNDLVIAEYSSLAPVLGDCRTKLRVVLLHDLFSSRMASFVEAGLVPDHHPVTQQEECARLEDADLCIHASQVDADLLGAQLPGTRHIWMRPVFQFNRSDRHGPPRAVFVGADHGGNRKALDLLLAEIWPEVRKKAPYELWIVGEISNWVTGRPEGVRCIKFMEDLRGLGNGNSIGIAPNQAASGISIKIGTYLGLGMQVLTFRKIAEAYGNTLDGFVVAVDTPAEFASTLVEMLQSRVNTVGCPASHFDAFQARMANDALLEYLRTRG